MGSTQNTDKMGSRFCSRNTKPGGILASMVFVIILHLNSQAEAFFLDLNMYYNQVSTTTSSVISDTGTNYDLTFGLDLTRRGRVVMGWSYNVTNVSDVSTTTTTYAMTEMGPKVGFYIDREKTWAIFFSYYLNTALNYNNGSSTETWRGTAIKTEIGYAAQMTDNLFAGLYLNIYQASLNEQISGSTLNSVSFAKALTYPAFHLSYRWE